MSAPPTSHLDSLIIRHETLLAELEAIERAMKYVPLSELDTLEDYFSERNGLRHEIEEAIAASPATTLDQIHSKAKFFLDMQAQDMDTEPFMPALLASMQGMGAEQ